MQIHSSTGAETESLSEEGALRTCEYEPSTDHIPTALPHGILTSPWQMSLKEMFFVTTLAAIVIGVYLYISSLLALCGGGAMIVAGAVSWSGTRNIVIGGIIGFVVAAFVTVGILVVSTPNMVAVILVGILGPAAGYLGGACLAELSDDGSL